MEGESHTLNKLKLKTKKIRKRQRGHTDNDYVTEGSGTQRTLFKVKSLDYYLTLVPLNDTVPVCFL